MVRDHRSNDQAASASAPPETNAAWAYRRGFLAVGAGLGSSMVAGCAGLAQDVAPPGNHAGDGGSGGGQARGRFRLLISDRPAAIGDFSELNVTFEKARIFLAERGDGSDNEGDGPDAPDNESGGEGPDDGADAGVEGEDAEAPEDEDNGESGYVDIDLDGERADLTELVGDRATQVADLPLEPGRYVSIHLYVDDVEGIASDQYEPGAHPGRGNGEDRENGGGPPAETDEDDDTSADDDTEEPVKLPVKVPSEKLKIVRPFEIAPEQAVAFVFDINVIRRGNGRHLLKPVIGESGIVGEDAVVEDVDGG